MIAASPRPAKHVSVSHIINMSFSGRKSHVFNAALEALAKGTVHH